ncbi:hypothetical protein VE03_07318 [Pseudogymnoascus sp. 23342-1-I1]|nr:hypothetical protein VE03_07318 [Pseudogymnoascus sp. 23342-1-I1]
MPDIPLSSQNASIMIPASLVSLETLLYIGLCSEKANDIWSSWTTWQPTEPYGPRRETDPDDGFGLVVTFHDFIIGSVTTNKTDAVGTDDDRGWRQCLDACGINKATQEAIMVLNQKLNRLRRSNSCLYCIKDTINLRYRGLEELRHTLGIPQQPSTASIEASNWDSPHPLNTPEYTTLFKPIDLAQTTNLLTQSNTLSNISPLLSPPPSDFSGGTRSSFHFPPSHDLAIHNAAYAKSRSPRSRIAILRLLIPSAAIESLAASDIQTVLWPSNEWRELVWRSRMRKPLPRYLRKYREATLVVGTVAWGGGLVCQGMETWEEVGGGWGGECAEGGGGGGEEDGVVQYVFSGEEEGREFLTENVEGAEVVPFSEAALEEFFADLT